MIALVHANQPISLSDPEDKLIYMNKHQELMACSLHKASLQADRPLSCFQPGSKLVAGSIEVGRLLSLAALIKACALAH